MSINAKRFGNAQASLNSSKRSCVSDAEQCAPIFQTESLTVHGVQSGVSTVANLLTPCRPCAILFAVSSVVVDALKSKTFWSWPHIAKEVRKRFPVIANSDASSSVVFKLFVFRVVATVAHILPAVIFRRSSHAMHGFLFVMEAAARARSTISKVITSNNYRFTAFTSTIPMTTPRFVPINDGKAAKGIATLQYFSGHIFSKLGAAC